MSGRISYLRYGLFYVLIAISAVFISAPPVWAALVNINTAGVVELDTLDGIGPAYAQRIIDYRTANGPFQIIEEVKNVKGIGDATFLKFKDSITVGSAQHSESTTQVENLDETDRTNETNVVSRSSSLSAHYGSESLSEYKQESGPSVSAGRARLGVAGGPIEFKAESDSLGSKLTSYKWSFGDGSIGEGQRVSHIYEYAGDYVVVLNIENGNSSATSRTEVRIVEPKISIAYAAPEKIEITSESGNEINLYGRALVANGKIFAFPKDTIIRPKARLIVSANITGLNPANAGAVAMLLVGESGSNNTELKRINQEFQEQITDLYEATIQIQESLATIRSSVSHTEFVVSTAEINKDTITSQEKEISTSLTEMKTEGTVAAAILSEFESNKIGFFEKVKRFFFRKIQ